jgi:hypothetical protein
VGWRAGDQSKAVQRFVPFLESVVRDVQATAPLSGVDAPIRIS